MTGTIAAGAPWKTAFSTVDTVTLGTARPAKVELWIYLPALERRGFFQVHLDPQAHPSALVAGAFGSFGEPLPAAEAPFDPQPLLPEGGVLVETARVAAGGPPRDLVLWVLSRSRHPRETPAEPYTCPEATRGHYLSGRARLSLVEPVALGTFPFEVDSSGRGGCREAWDVRCDPARELFTGTLTESGCAE